MACDRRTRTTSFSPNFEVTDPWMRRPTVISGPETGRYYARLEFDTMIVKVPHGSVLRGSRDAHGKDGHRTQLGNKVITSGGSSRYIQST